MQGTQAQKTRKGTPVTLNESVRGQVATLLSEVSAPTGMNDHRRALHEQLVKLENAQAADSTQLVAMVRRVLGDINNIARSPDKEERPLKVRAIALANQAIGAHSAPQRKEGDKLQHERNDKIIEISAGDTKRFLKWLQQELSAPTAKDWNTVNLATACYGLSKCHDKDAQGRGSPAWYTMGADALKTAELLAEHLANRCKTESCSAHSAMTLCRTLPHIVTALSLSRGLSGDLDARFINTLTSIIEHSHEDMERQFVIDKVFHPLSETRSFYLSSAGATALCHYAETLHNRLSAKIDFDMVRGVGDSFRSLRGISSWCDSPENQQSLHATLKLFNDRLEKAHGAIDSKGVTTILGGIKGIDYGKLEEPALSEAARTLALVTSKLRRMEGELNYQAVAAAIYSLGVATDVRSGPIQVATTRLLKVIEEKLPTTPPATLLDLGRVCSSLYTLRPVTEVYKQLKDVLWRRVDRTNFNAMDISGDNRDLVTAWSMIHQAYAVYESKPPSSLLRNLGLVKHAVDAQANKPPSAGEVRAREVLSCVPEIALLPAATTLAGFDLDIAGKRIDNKRGVNFEIDGPHHREPGQRRSDGIRDKFIRRNLIEVVRITDTTSDREIVTALSRHGFTVDEAKLAALRAPYAITA